MHLRHAIIQNLVCYASCITKKTSVMFVSELIQIPTQPSKDDFLKKHVEQRSKRQLTLQSQFKKDKIDAFVKVAHCVAPKTENVDESMASNVMQIVSLLIGTVGASKIQPNILMMNYLRNSPAQSEIVSYVDIIKSAFRLNQGVIINKKPLKMSSSPQKEIHIWWWIDDGGLITLLAHLLTKRGELQGAKLKFFTESYKNR